MLEHPLTESTTAWRLGRDLQGALDEECRRWDRDGLVGRLWRKDPDVWTGGDEARWLGWLDLPHAEVPADALDRFAGGVRADGLTDVLLLGMGGSSLGAEVVGHVLGGAEGAPALHVLDTTDPAQIARTASRIDLSRTLCIVSSKSGTTLEPALLTAHFQDRMRQAVGPARAGSHFVAITDPGSALEETAAAEGFRQVWSGRPDVGGRFSVLSSFGLVPAAACGVDVPAVVLAPARAMAERCGADVPAGRNPGVRLGLLLGLAAAAGRDKVTLVPTPSIGVLGGWLEQLLAESTGKAGRGLVPIVDEELGPPAAYGPDRLFVHLRVDDDAGPGRDAALADLAEAGHPVATLPVPGREALAAELFRWELATAACGAVLGVNPFDQPDVEAAKVAARSLTAAWEAGGGFPEEPPAARSDGIALFADAGTASRLRESAREPTLDGLVSAHVASAGPGDYVALLAYVDRSRANTELLQRIRGRVRDARRVATSVGFGPRYLHSTGQVFKGGPATGVFVLLTTDDVDLPVPGRTCTFGAVQMAQALGDLEVLAARGRRVVRLHLEGGATAGLERLASLFDRVTGA